MSIVTRGFKKAWRHISHTRKAAASRRWMKKDTHRRHRRAVRHEIAIGSFEFAFAPFATSWDVT